MAKKPAAAAAKTSDRMTPAQYAGHRGVSKQIVNRHIANHRLPKKNDDGMFDVAAADKAWAENVRSNSSNMKAAAKIAAAPEADTRTHDERLAEHVAANKRKAAPQDSTPSVNAVLLASGVRPEDLPAPPTPVDIQSGEGLLNIRRKDFEQRVEEGFYVERIPVENKVFEFALKVRNAGDNWVTRNYATIAAELGVSQHKVRLCLERHFREYHETLAGFDERTIVPPRPRKH